MARIAACVRAWASILPRICATSADDGPAASSFAAASQPGCSVDASPLHQGPSVARSVVSVAATSTRFYRDVSHMGRLAAAGVAFIGDALAHGWPGSDRTSRAHRDERGLPGPAARVG